jgi:hypothetical protein
MSNISGLLGTAGGFKGTGVDAPTNVTDPGQIAQSYAGTQNSMQAQQQLLQALQAQNALGNQSQVYNQMQGVVSGTGPNPAQAMLAQATGQNVQNQAALMAGQRGASGNVGLMARQNAQIGAGLQQQAAGQGATLQANQSLGALQAAGQMANTQANQQVGQTNANAAAQLQEQGNLMGAQANTNRINAGLVGDTASQQAAVGGGALSGAGSAMAAFAGGGVVGDPNQAQDQSQGQPKSGFGQYLKAMSNGNGNQGKQSLAPIQQGMNNFGAGLGKMIASWGNGPSGSATNRTDDQTQQDYLDADTALATHPGDGIGPQTQAQSLAGTEVQLPADNTDAFAKGGAVGNMLKAGGKVPGKPPVPGAVNTSKNDTVPALLSAGEVVLPRSVTQSSDPVNAAAQFMAALIKKQQMSRKAA